MNSDSPIDALLLKLKGKESEGADDTYDADTEAKKALGRKLIKAIQTGKAELAAEAVCSLIDLHEPKAPSLDAEDDE